MTFSRPVKLFFFLLRPSGRGIWDEKEAERGGKDIAYLASGATRGEEWPITFSPSLPRFALQDERLAGDFFAVMFRFLFPARSEACVGDLGFSPS